MSPLDGQHKTKAYWRSLAELDGAPEFRAFMETEFPAAADANSVNRRRWLQLMGASLAFAGVAGCRWQEEKILPFAERPEGRVPGAPERYATAMDLGGNAIGLMVTTVDGRPLKVEGNPAHPISGGATDVFAQAAILELYDPDRSQFVVQQTPRGETTPSWDEFDAFARTHFVQLRGAGGKGFCVLAEMTSSPTLASLRDRLLQALPEAKWFEYSPVSDDNERIGAQQAFDRPLRTQLACDRAEVILSLDADLLSAHPAALKHARQFAAGRDADRGTMNRLVVVESGVSVTGAAADHRLALQTRQIAGFVTALREQIGRATAKNAADPAEQSAPPGSGDTDTALRFARALAADLDTHRGRCIVVAGRQQPPAVHAEVHRLNFELGNVGKTVYYTQELDPDRPTHVDSMTSLVKAMRAGDVRTLVILGGNPVYDAPVDLEFAAALKKVATAVHLGLYRNETARACTWHLPQTHFLESWADARAFDGTYSVVQPMIKPLHGGRSAIELVATLIGVDKPKPEQLVGETLQAIAGGSSSGPQQWRRTLHDGLLADSQWQPEEVGAPSGDRLQAQLVSDNTDPNDLEIVFQPDTCVWDGRFANSGWLQECPRPITKLTWDNVAFMAPATAKALRVETGSVVRLAYRDRTLELPVFVLPGQAPGSVTVPLGYGRTAAGHVGGDTAAGAAVVGANTYRLRTAAAMGFAGGLRLEVTGAKHQLATTQQHHAIDEVGLKARAKRLGQLVREATLSQYQQHPDFAKHIDHHPPLTSLWEEHEYPGHRWGMSIDLSKCIGCSACVVACQAENNIPIVGKDQVLVGREMHWIRIDRYFRGDENDPGFAHQPLTCQHCELAPCEQVCPVNATVHSHEGLNDMVYNRCVGTRYCANNCPYKVRRFNYFNYHANLKDAAAEVAKLKFNPEVTVRARGVMEKCTYCVQRIQRVKIQAKNQRRPIADGQVKTACQQVCPTRAIVFGDLADPESEAARQRQHDRSYALLGELNVKPRTTYLARIRNPNPELEDDQQQHDGPTHG